MAAAVSATTTTTTPHSVVCVRALKESDLAATGSHDGYLRFWKVQTGRTLDERGISALCQVPLTGYLNDIAIGPEAKFAVVATGQEHRLGRFSSTSTTSSSSSSALLRGAKNRLAIVQLSTKSSGNDSSLNDGNSQQSKEEEEGNMLDVPEKDNGKEETFDSESSSQESSE
jgi:WD40 repeat protein